MTKLKSSLLDYLNRRNPRVQGIHEGETTNGSTTRNLRWDFPNKLEEWDDFNLNNFDVFYDKSLQDVLKNRYDFDDLPDVPLYPFCEIRDEDSLETLLIKSIQTTVSEALTVTQADLQSQGSGDIIYVSVFKFSTSPFSVFPGSMCISTYSSIGSWIILEVIKE